MARCKATNKTKRAFITKSGKTTGGGRMRMMPLSNIEQQVQLGLCEEQVNGIPGSISLKNKVSH